MNRGAPCRQLAAAATWQPCSLATGHLRVLHFFLCCEDRLSKKFTRRGKHGHSDRPTTVPARHNVLLGSSPDQTLTPKISSTLSAASLNACRTRNPKQLSLGIEPVNISSTCFTTFHNIKLITLPSLPFILHAPFRSSQALVQCCTVSLIVLGPSEERAIRGPQVIHVCHHSSVVPFGRLCQPASPLPCNW